MSNLIKWVSNFTNYSHSAAPYTRQRNMDKVNLWIENHPVDPKVSYLNYYKIDQYAKKIISSLKKIPIDKKNITKVIEHLISISYYHPLLKDRMIKHLERVYFASWDDAVRKELRTKLITHYP